MTDRGRLTAKQIEVLLRPLKANRVSKTQGNSYLESYDVIAHLIRIFGFEGWDSETVRGPDLIFEAERPSNTSTPSGRWDVAYKATVRLTVRDRFGNEVCHHEGSATGDGQNQSRIEAHDLALKAAESTAEKRAARKLGDQFGLSLYDKGSLDPLVKTVVAYVTTALTQHGGRGEQVYEDPVTTSGSLNPIEPSIPPLQQRAMNVADMQPDRFAPREGDGPIWDASDDGSIAGDYDPGPYEPQDEFEAWDEERAQETPEEPVADRITDKQKAFFEKLCSELHYDRHGVIHEILGVPVESVSMLSKQQASRVIDEMVKRKDAMK